MGKATIAEGRAENRGVLRHLDGDDGAGGGLHPDVLDRLTELASATGCDRVSRRGVRLLVHRATGVVVGCGFGTSYCLRTAGVPRGAGVRWAVRYSDGERLNVRREFGPGWVVGGWHDGEAEWVRAACARLSPQRPRSGTGGER